MPIQVGFKDMVSHTGASSAGLGFSSKPMQVGGLLTAPDSWHCFRSLSNPRDCPQQSDRAGPRWTCLQHSFVPPDPATSLQMMVSKGYPKMAVVFKPVTCSKSSKFQEFLSLLAPFCFWGPTAQMIVMLGSWMTWALAFDPFGSIAGFDGQRAPKKHYM
jgi:hypothetical protein